MAIDDNLRCILSIHANVADLLTLKVNEQLVGGAHDIGHIKLDFDASTVSINKIIAELEQQRVFNIAQQLVSLLSLV